MIAKDAYLALSPTLNNIAGILNDAGVDTKIKCSFSNFDLLDQSEATPASTNLYGEILFSVGEDAAMLECAVSVIDGEVSDDELRSEISALRAEARRIAELAGKVGCDKLFDALDAETEENDAESEKFDEAEFDKLELDELLKDVEQRAKNQQQSPLPFIIGGVLAAAVVTVLLIVIL